MKRRIQITVGPQTRKALSHLAKEHEAESGMKLTELVLMSTAARLGLALMLKSKFPKLAKIESLQN